MTAECNVCGRTMPEYEFGLGEDDAIDTACLECRAKELDDVDFVPKSYRHWASNHLRQVPLTHEKALMSSYPKYTLMRLLVAESNKKEPEGIAQYQEYLDRQRMSPAELAKKEEREKDNRRRRLRREWLRQNDPSAYKHFLAVDRRSKG